MGITFSKTPLFVHENGAVGYLVRGRRQENCLDLSSNEIKTLEDNFAVFNKTKEIDLSFNSIEHIPVSLCRLKNLGVLRLEKNTMEKIPAAIGQLENLRELHLGWNKLKTVPKELCFLKRLEILALNNNQIRFLPVEVRELGCLRVLDIKHNKLVSLPIELVHIESLQQINTHGCPLYEEVRKTGMPCCKKTHIKKKYTAQKKAKNTACTHPLRVTVPPLLHIAGRAALLGGKPFKTTSTIKHFLVSAKECSFCRGPYFDRKCIYRLRFLKKNTHAIPFHYSLCRRHWDDEEERLRAVFEFETSH
ncbi:MAG: leucine-rich repeat protein [Amphiamblys sp. WSBS2006]|nr:MAG: leucine-rich repeat protein [Amphiamblys sp. WSBS2006]